MTRPPKIDILGPVSPVMRTVTCALLKARADNRTHATNVVRGLSKEAKAGFVQTRHLDTALELAAACRKRHRDKPGNGLGGRFCSMTFFGIRSAMQQNEDHKRSSDRARLALHMERPIWIRLTDLRDETAIPAAKAVMKHGASGGSRFFVTVGPEADYRVVMQRVWFGNDDWARLIDEHHITVRPTWIGTVRRLGSATVGRHFIVDATPFLEMPGRSVWTARLARTGRGYQAVIETSFLSVYGDDITVHGTLQKALSTKPPAGAVQVEPPIPDEDLAALEVALA